MNREDISKLINMAIQYLDKEESNRLAHLYFNHVAIYSFTNDDFKTLNVQVGNMNCYVQISRESARDKAGAYLRNVFLQAFDSEVGTS